MKRSRSDSGKGRRPHRVTAAGCWILPVKPLPSGYVQIKRGGRIYRAHRWYYEKHVGPIPPGREVDHTCGVLACVNPGHLEPVTPTENKRRSRATKITLADARAIRASTEDCGTLARRYGIHPSNVSHIRAGRSWADAA
jgi:hypothetical protein